MGSLFEDDNENDPEDTTTKDNLRRKLRRRSIKNAVIGDNIGDAFKDIAGPSINILIKFTAFFSLIIINYLII